MSVAAAPIARDNSDLRSAGEPFLRCGRFPIREQRDCLATLEIADDRPVALIAPPCPVINPDDVWRLEAQTAASTHNAQERSADGRPQGCLVLLLRRFYCDAVLCGRRIFTERFDADVLEPWARRTARLDYIVHHLALALDSRPATSFAQDDENIDCHCVSK